MDGRVFRLEATRKIDMLDLSPKELRDVISSIWPDGILQQAAGKPIRGAIKEANDALKSAPERARPRATVKPIEANSPCPLKCLTGLLPPTFFPVRAHS